MQLPDLSDWLEDCRSIGGISSTSLRRSLFFSFHKAVPGELHDEDIKDEIVAAASRLKQEPAKYLHVNKDEISKQCQRFDQEVFVVGELFRVCYVAGIRSHGKCWWGMADLLDSPDLSRRYRYGDTYPGNTKLTEDDFQSICLNQRSIDDILHMNCWFADQL
jgi:hypothetical protein